MHQQPQSEQYPPIWQNKGFVSRDELVASLEAEAEAEREAIRRLNEYRKLRARADRWEKARDRRRNPDLQVLRESAAYLGHIPSELASLDPLPEREVQAARQAVRAAVHALHEVCATHAEMLHDERPSLNVLREWAEYLEDITVGLAKLHPTLPDVDLKLASERMQVALETLRRVRAVHEQKLEEGGHRAEGARGDTEPVPTHTHSGTA